ncbi:Ribose 5-phosphate isomerase (RpiA) (PDB:1KS2) [Commensalibacter communis]|uniref:ribose-5-phosphate isomerase RpiA n=1 Tax=Commensalibacter communis TaxID=2972786 RepID=UPI0022FF60E8|nr:ribose-5-phosphate isomerase RpiA [Commensalibacter communis]CAI3937704.1 Ribose 5-phosphate isomerase (RpiA) (PDB:1KS2) [Commensalibacter communis]CAI3938925.1 Ribose 5-phosphate isomerase (RpiA) (PDB:1KS2) [Commensalibacter communis]
MDASQIEIYKQQVGKVAASLVTSGMKVGLGSGSTAACVVRALGKRWQEEGLRFIGVPTSVDTAHLAQSFGIELTTLGKCPELDLDIDGADEVTHQHYHLIKGLGGALLREKIVRYAAKKFVVVVDERKMVNQLGDHTPIPVEVTPFGWEATAKHLEKIGATISIRLKKESKEFFLTDGANMILDCHFGLITDPAKLEKEINEIVGVMENGLFIHCTDEVLIAGHDGIQHLK